jgi:hypothetical protein
MNHRVKSLTTSRAHAGTQPAVSLHQRSVAEGVIGKTETCVTSSVAEMHVAALTADGRSMSALSKNGVMKETMTTMVLSITSLTDSVSLMEGAIQEESKPSPMI